jgi:hypothetical protein
MAGKVALYQVLWQLLWGFLVNLSTTAYWLPVTVAICLRWQYIITSSFYEGHFINNAHYFFYRHLHFILGSISLQCFYVVPVLRNDRVPTFRKICYSTEGTTSVQGSDSSGNRCRKLFQGGKALSTYGLFQLLGISRSLVDSCLDGMAREVTLPTRIYSANRSQTSPDAGLHCRAKWVAHPRASQVSFYAFLCAIFAWSHDNILLSRLTFNIKSSFQ